MSDSVGSGTSEGCWPALTFGIPILIAMGPCLLMAMASLALFIIYRSFSRARHAIVWSASCGMSVIQGGIMAVRGQLDGAPLHAGLLVDLCGLVAILLLAEGFRVRARPRPSPLLPVLVGGCGAAALAGLFLFPLPPLRAAVTPLATIVLLCWAARLTVTAEEDHASATEIAVVTTLLLLVLVNLSAASLAIGEQLGLVGTRLSYIMVYAFIITPSVSAVSSTLLLLIAHDFSMELRRIAHADPLTGVLNRLGLEHAARAALRRARTRGLSVAITDIDLFKQVNDRHGHIAGDATLVRFAAHLAEHLGRDAVARIGGEEFALLIPGADRAAALDRIEPLRDSVAMLAVPDYAAVAITASFGIAELRPGETLEQVLERADAALYCAKRDGRNRTILADGVALSR